MRNYYLKFIINIFFLLPLKSSFVFAGGYHPSPQYIAASYIPVTIERIFIYKKLNSSVKKISVGCEARKTNLLIRSLSSRDALYIFLSNEITCLIVPKVVFVGNNIEVMFPFIDRCDDVIDGFNDLKNNKDITHLSYGSEFANSIKNGLSPMAHDVFDIQYPTRVFSFFERIKTISFFSASMKKDELGTYCLARGVIQ